MRDILIKVALGCVIFAIGGVTGYWVKKPETKVETKVVEKEVEKKVYVTDKSTIQKKETKPDGTVTETTVNKNVVSDSKTSTSVVSKMAAKTGQTTWGLGIGYNPFDKGISVDIGRRVISDLWVTGIYDLSTKHAFIGIRVEK